VQKLVKNSLLVDPLLMDESTDGAHGKTPVDQLNCLVFLHLRWVLAETKRIKPKVSWCPLALHCRLQSGDTNDRFPARNEKVDLSESTSLHEVVVRIHCKDAFGEIGPWEGEQLRNQEAQCCKHANSAVLDLSFLHPSIHKRIQKLNLDCVPKEMLKALVTYHLMSK